jgi:arginyl-tRNA synthetase
MNLEVQLKEHILSSLKGLFGGESLSTVQIEKTKPVYKGDYTLVVFPIVRFSKKSPEETAKLIGEELIKNKEFILEYNVIKGFLNLVINPQVWLNLHKESWSSVPQISNSDASKIMVEYSSPNTNKPLHLGHIRNNLLGYSISQILKTNGHEVIMANLINDRGIHICKSMLAWQRFGNNETPRIVK